MPQLSSGAKRRKNRRPRRDLFIRAFSGAVVLILAAGLFLFLFRPAPPPPTPAINKAEATKVPAEVDILVPIKNIEEGMELKPSLFRKESRAASELSSLGVVSELDRLAGAYAKSFIPAGHPLLLEQLSLSPPVNGVVPQIRPGYRAITIKLDRQTTNEGWARAGVRVDVVWSDLREKDPKATIIAQNLRVLSSGTSVSPEFGGESKLIQNGESTITLEVSVEDQKRLKLASNSGSLRVLLRGDDDQVSVQESFKTSLAGVAVPAREGTPLPVSGRDQGWVVIDGRRFKLVGGELKPD
jgi:Flp pilus assembly protein CpaB